jgi:hypothetical protein
MEDPFFIVKDEERDDSPPRRFSIEWYADFKTFPADIDRRPIGEVLLGTDINSKLGSFLNRYKMPFFAVGILIHVIGIGSISGNVSISIICFHSVFTVFFFLFFFHIIPYSFQLLDVCACARSLGYTDALRSVEGGIDYSVWAIVSPFATLWFMLLLSTMSWGLFKLVVLQFKPVYIMMNAAIFSAAMTSYLWSERRYFVFILFLCCASFFSFKWLCAFNNTGQCINVFTKMRIKKKKVVGNTGQVIRSVCIWQYCLLGCPAEIVKNAFLSLLPTSVYHTLCIGVHS